MASILKAVNPVVNCGQRRTRVFHWNLHLLENLLCFLLIFPTLLNDDPFKKTRFLHQLADLVYWNDRNSPTTFWNVFKFESKAQKTLPFLKTLKVLAWVVKLQNGKVCQNTYGETYYIWEVGEGKRERRREKEKNQPSFEVKKVFFILQLAFAKRFVLTILGKFM